MIINFLQSEFNKYGEENFIFTVEFEGQVTVKEIGIKEQEYVSYYDSYHNGYNQNEGGNFGPSNGGSKFIKSDIFNILTALEFMSRPGVVLAKMYETTTTTISRIKSGQSHSQYKEEYYSLPLEERKAIYKIFCDSSDFYKKKVNTTILSSKRHLTKEQVFLVLLNKEYGVIVPWKELARRFHVASSNTLYSILNGKSYKETIP